MGGMQLWIAESVRLAGMLRAPREVNSQYTAIWETANGRFSSPIATGIARIPSAGQYKDVSLERSAAPEHLPFRQR